MRERPLETRGRAEEDRWDKSGKKMTVLKVRGGAGEQAIQKHRACPSTRGFR